MKASSPTVATFLAGLPAERRAEVERVRDAIRRRLPAGYEEVVSKNMLVYQVPLEKYPDTYNGHPLWYVALASEKSYLSLHLMPVYGDKALAEQLAEGFRSAGKKLDMGKACIHFKKRMTWPSTSSAISSRGFRWSGGYRSPRHYGGAEPAVTGSSDNSRRSSMGSTGLVRCRSKPASWTRR